MTQTTTPTKCEVCCIGGGISGLTAVHELCESFIVDEKQEQKHMKNFILIESSKRFGGRIRSEKWTITNPNNRKETRQIDIDVGAAYLHGINYETNSNFIQLLHNKCNVQFSQNTNITDFWKVHYDSIHHLIKEKCSIKMTPIYSTKYNKFYYLNDCDVPFISNIETLWDNYIETLTKNDIILIEEKECKLLPEDTVSFYEWMTSNIQTDEDTLNYAQLIHGTENAIDIRKLGMKQYTIANLNWNYGESVIDLNAQFSKLIEYFESSLKNKYKHMVDIVMDSTVNKIKYDTHDGVSVYTSNGHIIQCKYCIITVPITVLQRNLIEFEPQLSIKIQDSISKLYAGNGGKIYLQFNKRFWSKNISTVYVMDGVISELIFTEYNKQSMDDFNVYIVCALAFGIHSKILIKSKKEIIEDIMGLIGTMFDLKDVECIDSFIFDWSKVQNINCTYSSPIVNSDGAKQVLREGINDILFFAGDHLAQSFPAVQEVMNTATNIVERIISQYQLQKTSML